MEGDVERTSERVLLPGYRRADDQYV